MEIQAVDAGDSAKRKKAIAKEQRKLMKMFEPLLSAEDFKTAAGMIENVAFMRVSLTEIRTSIEENGYVESYDNGGGQKGLKDSTYLRSYNNLMKTYNTTMKLLLSIVPRDLRGEVDDGFDSF